MQTGDFLIQMFGQDINLVFILVSMIEEFNLRHDLVGEGSGHDKAGVAGGATQIHQSALGENDDAFAIGKNNVINLRFDFHPLVFFQ